MCLFGSSSLNIPIYPSSLMLLWWRCDPVIFLGLFSVSHHICHTWLLFACTTAASCLSIIPDFSFHLVFPLHSVCISVLHQLQTPATTLASAKTLKISKNISAKNNWLNYFKSFISSALLQMKPLLLAPHIWELYNVFFIDFAILFTCFFFQLGK